jgi:tetratricopeptide (TPR) repeat protein
MGEYRRQLGEYAAARRQLERALALARQVGDSHTEILALSTLGRAAMVQGAYAEAKPHLAAALALAEKTGDREAAAQVLLNLADASFRLGDADGASASARESLQIYAGLKDRQGVAGAHRVLGFASMMRGDNAGAALHHQEGLEIFEEIGDRWGVATCLINLGEVHRKMGRFDEAVSFWERSLPISRDIGARLSVAIGHVNMGGVLAGMELREDRARKNLREALREATEIGAVPIALEGLVSAALLYIREEEPLRAAKLLGTVVAHPSFNAEIQEYSDPLLKRVEKKVGPEALRAALDWGRGRDFATVVAEVVKDFGVASRPDRPR